MKVREHDWDRCEDLCRDELIIGHSRILWMRRPRSRGSDAGAIEDIALCTEDTYTFACPIFAV